MDRRGIDMQVTLARLQKDGEGTKFNRVGVHVHPPLADNGLRNRYGVPIPHVMLQVTVNGENTVVALHPGAALEFGEELKNAALSTRFLMSSAQMGRLSKRRAVPCFVAVSRRITLTNSTVYGKYTVILVTGPKFTVRIRRREGRL